MRKLVLLLATGVMVATASGAGAAPVELGPRTVERPYNYCEPGLSGGCRFGGTEFEVRRGERFVTIQLNDASDRPVFAAISQDPNERQEGDEMFQTFCGRAENVAIIPNVPLRLSTSYYDLPPPTCEGAPALSPTTGIAVAIFRK